MPLEAGTTLRIAPGRYRGGLAVRGIEHLVVEGADPERPPEFVGGANAWQFSRCDGLVVRNIVCRGQTGNGLNIDDGGEMQRPVHGVRIQNVTVLETGPRGNTDGIKCSGLTDLVIEDCRIEGWGGQAIDFVGCRDAVIRRCRIIGRDGFSQATGPRFKGGSEDVVIEDCVLVNAGQRPIHAGGSTGLEYFRPPGAKYEARRITIRRNVIVGHKGADSHHRFRHVRGRDGDDAFTGFHQSAIRMVPRAGDERQLRREIHHHGPGDRHDVLPAPHGGRDQRHRPGLDQHEGLGEWQFIHGVMLKLVLDSIAAYATFGL